MSIKSSTFRCRAAIKPASAALAIVAAVAFVANAAAAEKAQSFHADYYVSYLGLTIAKSSFKSTISDRSFSLDGSLSSAGLAELFDDTKGTTSASGSFSRGIARPDVFAADYTTGRKAKKIAISFADGTVIKTVNVPPPKPRGDDWVAVGENQLRDVADPLSATLVRADSLDKVCGRTLQVFDGELRADLALALAERGPVSIGGYEGDAVVCEGRFMPVAGYRKGHKSIEYLKNRSKIRITFAPLGTTGVYAPIRATVGTRIGTITISARGMKQID
jgi:hypothetical protein